jgi:primary-amine oxidase
MRRTERGVLASFACAMAMLAPAAPAAACPAGTTAIDQTLATGTRWELCVEQRTEEGIVLRDVFLTPPSNTRRSVLKEASVAQIFVVYDDDSARRLLVSDPGLGGSSFVALATEDCPSGTLLLTSTLCMAQAGRGYAWKDDATNQQGYWLELFSISRTDALTWIVRWRLYDDGTVEPAVGSTGSLSVFGTNSSYGTAVGGLGGPIAVGWFANTTWRLDFDIGTSATDDFVERFEVANEVSTKSLSKTPISTELGESYAPVVKRAWRVRDAATTNTDTHPISYYFEPILAGHHYVPKASEPWAAYDFAVTRHNSCERLAAGNPTAGGCAADLAGFLDGQSATGDVVLWVRTTVHHLPHDEDSPYLGTTWQSIAFGARDWTSVNPLVTP